MTFACKAIPPTVTHIRWLYSLSFGNWSTSTHRTSPLCFTLPFRIDDTRNVATMEATAASVTVKMTLIFTLPVEETASYASTLPPNVWTSRITLAAEEFWAI